MNILPDAVVYYGILIREERVLAHGRNDARLLPVGDFAGVQVAETRVGVGRVQDIGQEGVPTLADLRGTGRFAVKPVDPGDKLGDVDGFLHSSCSLLLDY